MFSKFLSTVLAASVALAPVGAAAQSKYYFRFRTVIEVPTPQPPAEEEYGLGNDIHAYYTLPIGREFEKKIPVATRDVVEWRKDSGTFPDGIALDEAGGEMTGQPTTNGKETLLYHGYDAEGHRIARAELNFTVFTPVGIGADLALYDHTGRYFYSDLPNPQGVDVYRWEPIDGDASYPVGMSMMGNAFQGTPIKAGTYGIGWIGYDFVGRQVAYASGEFLVEDGPVVDDILSQTIDIEKGQTFDRQAIVEHGIGAIRYRLVADTAEPYGATFDEVSGRIGGAYSSFETSASYHVVATDLGDGTTSKPSNSFMLSTLPQSAGLSNLGDMVGYLHADFNLQLSASPLPSDAKWTVAGQLPDGVDLDESTGLISGQPTKLGIWRNLRFTVSGTGIQPSTNQLAVNFRVLQQRVTGKLEPLVVRTDTAFSTKGFTVTAGKVDPMFFAAANPSTVDPALDMDPNSGVVSSATGIATPGSHGFAMIATNSDGSASRPMVQSIDVYNPLSISYAADTHVKRLSASLSLSPRVADNSIVGDPKFSLSGAKPDWMRFSETSGTFTGTPIDKSTTGQVYGPFTVALSDESNDPAVESDPFMVTVDERDQLKLDVVNTEAERFVDNQKSTLKVSHAYGAAHVTLVQSSLTSAKSTLQITDNGTLVGKTTDDLGTTYPNLVATVTDDDDLVGQSSSPFSLTVVNPSSLKPLTGSMDVVFTWTKNLPLPADKVLLPLLSNTYGNVTYGFVNAEPGLSITPTSIVSSSAVQPVVLGTIADVGTTTHSFNITDESGRAPAVGTLTLNVLDKMTAQMADVVTNVGSSLNAKPAVANAVGKPVFGSLTGAVVPSWLTFDRTTGTLGGRPNDAAQGDFGPFTFTVTDPTTGLVANPAPNFSVHVGPRMPYTVTYGDGSGILIWDGSGDYAPNVTGAIGTVRYSLDKGSESLPAGLVFGVGSGYSSAGLISGTPSPAGFYPGILVGATDMGFDPASIADDNPVTVPLTAVVMPKGPIVFPAASFTVRKDHPFTGLVLTASNTVESDNVKTTFEPTSANGIGPDVILSSDGKLSGTLSTLGKIDLGVTVKDALFPAPFNRASASTTVTLEVKDVVSVAAPTTASFNQNTFSALPAPAATNGIGTVTFTLSPDASTLPAGLTFHGDTGIIDGTPTVQGDFGGWTISAIDGFDNSTSQPSPTFSIHIEKRNALAVTMPGDIVLQRYGKVPAGTQVSTTNALPDATAVNYTVSPTLPAGITLNKDGSIIGSSKSLSGQTLYTVTATDAFGGIDGTKTGAFKLLVGERDALSLAVPSSVTLKQYEVSTAAATAQGAAPDASMLRYSISPSLPGDLKLNEASGQITGSSADISPATTYTVTATDGSWNDDGDPLGKAIKSLTLEVQERDPLTVVFPATLRLKQWAASTLAVAEPTAAIPNAGAVTYVVTPDLPGGVTLDTSGTISGTPTVEVPETTYTLTSTDAIGGKDGTATSTFTLSVAPRDALSVDGANTYAFQQYSEGSVTLKAQNHLGTAVWTLPTLPTWLTVVQNADGSITISGTPDEKMDATDYVFLVNDDHGPVSAAFTLSLSVGDRKALHILPEPPANVAVGGFYDHDLLPSLATLSLENASGAVTWSVSGTLPAGVFFDGATGTFSGKPSEFGQFPKAGGTLQVTATDSKGGTETRDLKINILQDGTPITITSTQSSTNVHIGSTVTVGSPAVTNGIGTFQFATTGLSGTGLSASTKDGAITGTPNMVGTVTASINVSDDTGRTSETPAVETIVVLPALTASAAPAASVVYNHTSPAGAAPTTQNAEGAVTWFLASGTLPTGMSVDPATGALVGAARQLGDFGPIFVKAVDSLGGSGGTAVSKTATTVHVDMNSDPIALTVQDYTTHVGALITTSVPVYDNNLGAVTFFSADVAALGLTINPATGVISGRINANTDAFINVSVKDADTSRITSKPLHLMVLPALRITVPTLVSVQQGTAVTQTVTTAFKAGTVSYEKVGTWPVGIELNQTTGAITGTTNDAIATYGSLTIKGTDTFGGGQKDVQSSNVFSIKVGPTDAKPVISPVASTPVNKAQLYTVGTAMSFTPVVVDDKKGEAWTYLGTVYKLNHDIKADSGLDFDATTGTISGTATKPIIYKDLTITVTSSKGDSSATPAYWFGVQPKDPIAPTAAELASLNTYVRVPDAYASTTPGFDNTYGTLTYALGVTPGTNSFSTTTGILSNTVTKTADLGDWPAPVTVTDEFGRTGTTPRRLVVLPTLTVNAPNIIADTINPATITTTTTGVQGTATYTWTGLPAGLTPTAAGDTVTGTLSASATGDPWNATVTVQDSKDKATASKAVKISKGDPSKWRVSFSSWVPHPSVGLNCFGLAELKIFNGSTEITSTSTVTPAGTSDVGYGPAKLVDGTTSGMWFQINAVTVPPMIAMTTTKPITSLTFWFRQDAANACMPKAWTVQQGTADGTGWLDVWSDSILPVANNPPYTTKSK
jgi:hypothetical protein